MAGPGPNQTALARYVAGSAARTIPTDVVDAARLCLADWLGVAIGAGEEPAGRIVRETVAGWGATGSGTTERGTTGHGTTGRGTTERGTTGRASVIYGGTAAAPFAALANGTLAHCLDFDDTHVGAITHTSAPVWAATLAAGEELGASEADMLRAFITGFEVATRAGNGLGQAVTARGFHSTGVWGRIGAAAAVAVLMDLDEGRVAHALGVAATQASGLVGSFGTMAKPFHAGKAAMDGVLAAQLAAAGFTGALDLIEPGAGLDRALVQDGSVKITPASFEDWEIRRNSFKPYAACHLVHPSADAARALAITPERIARIRATVSPLAMQVTGGASGRPATPLAAKFDLKYCIALALHGHTLSAADFVEPWLPDRDVLATAERVEPTGDASIGFASARLEAEMAGGATKSSVITTAKGHPGNPMTWDDMRGKLDGLVARPLGGSGEALIGHVRGFGSGRGLAGIRGEIARLGRGPTRPSTGGAAA